MLTNIPPVLDAPNNTVLFTLGNLPDLYVKNFEEETGGWTIGDPNDDATAGNWELAEKDHSLSLKILPNQAYTINYLAYSWIEKEINTEKALTMLNLWG